MVQIVARKERMRSAGVEPSGACRRSARPEQPHAWLLPRQLPSVTGCS